jgi:hypothetical protein
MKKVSLVTVLAGVLGLAQMLQAQEVRSVNTVGFYKVTIPPAGKFVMMAMAFDQVGSDPATGGANTFLDVFGTNQLRQHTVAANADRIYRWNGLTYDIFNQRVNGLFYKSGAVTNPPINAGDAFWIQSPGSATSNRDIVIAGQVVEVATNIQKVAVNFNMLGYPFSSDVGINQMGFRAAVGSKWHNAVPANADRLYVYNGSGYDIYGLKSNGWATTTGYAAAPPTTNTLRLGQGFWYQAKSNQWDWAETNRYLQALQTP